MTGPVLTRAKGPGPVDGGDHDEQVRIWSMRVPAARELDAFDLSVLDAEERRRMKAFRRSEDRVRYGFAHVALRRILAARLDVEPYEVRFGRDPCPVCAGPHGRPVLAAPSARTRFSLSHCGQRVLVAVAELTVGVDVEGIPGGTTVTDVVRALHPAERAAVEAVPLAERGAAFARVWARKEAYLKGIGTGLGRDLAQDDTGAPIPGWRLVDLPVDDEHAAALAVHSPRPPTIGLHVALP
ncbi:4'-phosphopantetheinyl transferase superfamily protein [Streptomyces sp. MB09-01]|uniref:4'-phosphopantetheinyl transferase family protein n=1 Tax=Streptomyces sp. MB09-01 TaxID=3028666 RepID=UPI0029B412DD|nr:4'-phosphopantetheinyl transferase superfamily protein [Streptomyces sp. MB09-01]MDX3533892.1 4'-phosphopantetheinyl transferase superfamily protein [Streptomyces sp. MB09-01]